MKFLLSLITAIALVYVLHNPVTLGDKSIPPMGKLLDPFGGFWQNAESEEAFASRKISLRQLSDKAEVIYDERLVPHIFAANTRDAVFLQGYIYARHRLWQMDISTRDIGGRLAEILGPKLLERDLKNRRMGMRTAAMKTLNTWSKSPEHIRLVEAYAAGVNAWLAELDPADYPVEFKLMNYAPEPWTPLKSALFSIQMARNLCGRDDDFASSNALRVFGKEMYDFLYPEHNPDQAPIIPGESIWDFEVELPEEEPDTAVMMGFIPSYDDEPWPVGIGSNNWAVSGEKTANGNPILCSDPHLGLTLPSIWFEMQLHTPEANTYGVSLPGLMGTIIGFNENIAWGMTNVAQDVQDWYRIKWADDSRTHYIVDGQKIPVELVVEPILVKDSATVFDTVRYTHFGPVVYDDLAMHWLGQEESEPGGEMVTFLELSKAKTYDEHVNALNSYNIPPQNIVFANQAGDIAMTVTGKFPIKPEECGKFVFDGSTARNSWKGFVPKQHIPRVKNPARGYVSSANQHSTCPDYPYPYHGRFAHYRGRGLNNMLDTMREITVEDMMALQNNTFSQKAADALPLLLGHVDVDKLADGAAKDYFRQLSSWNYHFDKDLLEPVLFSVWFDEFYDMVWDEMAAKAAGEKILYPESWRATALMRDEPGHVFFDELATPEREDAKTIARKSFGKMVDVVAGLKEEHAVLNWRFYKGTDLRHLGRIPAFTLHDIDVGGDASSLNANTAIHGPSWRMVVELSDPVRAYGVYPGGQSGNPGSRFYDDMVAAWAAGEYYELRFFGSLEEARAGAFFRFEIAALSDF